MDRIESNWSCKLDSVIRSMMSTGGRIKRKRLVRRDGREIPPVLFTGCSRHWSSTCRQLSEDNADTQNSKHWQVGRERESRLSSLTAIEIIEVILIGECWLSDRVADECEERAEILGKSSLEGGQAVQRGAAAGGGGRCGSQHARRWTASVSAEISGAARQEWPCDQQQQQQKWSTNCPVDQQQ